MLTAELGKVSKQPSNFATDETKIALTLVNQILMQYFHVCPEIINLDAALMLRVAQEPPGHCYYSVLMRRLLFRLDLGNNGWTH